MCGVGRCREAVMSKYACHAMNARIYFLVRSYQQHQLQQVTDFTRLENNARISCDGEECVFPARDGI